MFGGIYIKAVESNASLSSVIEGTRFMNAMLNNRIDESG